MENEKRTAVWVLLVLVCLGCANVHPLPPELAAAGEGRPSPPPMAVYRLQVGDALDIKFYYNPELNEHVIVRPDGRISLQLIDEVQVSGKTPAELDRLLTTRYERIFVKPEITVIVREFGGRQTYVGGEVSQPGALPLTARLTALQAVMRVGGFRETADPSSVILIRKDDDDRPVSRRIDLGKVLTGEATENDIALQPFDVVYVPKTAIANLNQFIDQHINKIVPDFVSAGFSYTRGKIRQTGEITNTVTPEP